MTARILDLPTFKPTPGPNAANLEALTVLRAQGPTLGLRVQALLGIRRPVAPIVDQPVHAPRAPGQRTP